MLHITIGILFFIGLIIFIYLTISNSPLEKKKLPETKENPKKEDIVLAELTEFQNPDKKDYGLLWNATKGSYDYLISAEGKEIAKGTVSSENNIFKIKGLPLEHGKTYTVQVGDTFVDVNFSPPSFLLETLTLEDNLECDTNMVPTNLEIIAGAVLIPKFNCHFKMEPPGFICNVKGYTDLVLMIYNGPNAVNILSGFQNLQ